MQEHSGLDCASAAGATGSSAAAARGSAAQGLLCLRDGGGASETASGGPLPASGLSGTAAQHYSCSAPAAESRHGTGLKRPLASTGFPAAGVKPCQARRLGPSVAAGSSPASAAALAAGLGSRHGNDAPASSEEHQGSRPVRPSSVGPTPNAAAQDDMRIAKDFDLRTTSDPAASAPPLPSSRERVYLPQPSAPLPPGASPFMGALSGYFGVSPPVPGAKPLPAWQPAHPRALDLQLPLDWRPLTVSAPPPGGVTQQSGGERPMGPARLTGFADRPASHAVRGAAGSAAAGASYRADAALQCVHSLVRITHAS